MIDMYWFVAAGFIVAILIPILFWPRKQRVPEYKSSIPPYIRPNSKSDHKHLLRLTKGLWFAVDGPHPLIPKNVLAWQCHCGAYLTKDRIELKEEMVPRWANADQVWPG